MDTIGLFSGVLLFSVLCRLPVSDICRLQSADCRLQTADCRLQTAAAVCSLQMSDTGLPVRLPEVERGSENVEAITWKLLLGREGWGGGVQNVK